MKRLMVRPAKGHREFVADFSPQCSWLGELEMMGVGRRLLTNKATLAADKSKVLLASVSRRVLWKREAGMVRPEASSW